MGKSKRSDKEFTREQRLIKQNKQLKQELKYLRKQLSKIDDGRLDTIKEMCLDYEEGERIQEDLGDPNSSMEALKKEWTCNKCNEGWLEITLYSKLGETFYYRKCSQCDNRTKGQRYDSASVKGILVNSQTQFYKKNE